MIYDAIIIGGGPAGATAAMTLRQAGRTVLVLEKEIFPRFHIGESLLPYNLQLFRELDLLPQLQGAGFMKKMGAQFHLSNGSKAVQVKFTEGRYNEETWSFQVERSVFDHMLLNEAKSRGAEVIEGCAVSGYEVEADQVKVQTDQGEHLGRFLIDASGMHSFTGVKEGIRELDPQHRKVAIFAHFDDLYRPADGREGDIIIVRLENEWSWLIPLSDKRTSVGLVLESSRLKGRKPEDLFWELVNSSSVLMERLKPAQLVGSVKTIVDYSYKNRTFVSPRLVRVGDAAGFIDPIFSSGVYLAMKSAQRGAQEVDHALSKNKSITRGLHRYEKWLRRAMNLYWKMIEGFYTRPFIEVFVSPRPFMNIPSAVNSVLAGRLDFSWQVRWRLRIFYTLVALRRWLPLTEPIRFD